MIAQQPTLTHFSVEDGLPSSHVYCAIQDNEGYMWLGTDRGLVKFDGYTFTTFTTKDGLPSNDVWQLSLDTTGVIWIDAYDHLVYVEDDIVHSKPYLALGKDKMIQHFFDNQQKHYLKGKMETDLGVFHTQDSIRLISRPDERLGLKNIYYDKEENLSYYVFLATINGKRAYYLRAFSDTTTVKERLIWDGEERIFGEIFTIANGFYFFPKRQLKAIGIINGERREIPFSNEDYGGIIHITRISEDKLFINSENKRFVVDTLLNQLPEFDFINQLGYTNSIYEDDQQNIWICTTNGLYLQTKTNQSLFTYPITQNNIDHVISISIDKKEPDLLWLGTKEGHLYQFNLKTKEASFYPFESDNSIVDIINTKDFLICNAKNELKVFSKARPYLPLEEVVTAKKLRYQYNTTFNASACKSIVKSNDSTIVFSQRINLWEILFEKESYAYRKIAAVNRSYALETNDNQTYYVGKKSGLYSLQSDSLSPLLIHEKPFTYAVSNLALTENNHLWIGTDAHGLYHYRAGHFHKIPELENEYIKHLYIHDDKTIWVSTNQGLIKINLMDGDSFQYTIQRIDQSYGLPSLEINQIAVDSQHAYIISREGLTIFPLKQLNNKVEASNLVLQHVLVNDSSYTATLKSPLNLSYHENNIAFHYAALSYENIGNVVYEYQLEGIDQQWHTSNRRSINYPALPAGDYKFRVRIKNIENERTRQEQQFTFTIHPPWWQSYWFITLSILTIGGFIYWQFDRFRQREREKTTINKKIAELELQALQAQMNPHFIFNALHAIQDFVMQADIRSTNRYLVKFSRLMRLFLESSKEKYIFLVDEIHLLELYVELEQLRFGDKFDYQIQVDDAIDIHSIEIPSMVIQPFIENAINHGLLHKRTKGNLSIRFFKEDHFLICIIEDDGVGRTAAKKIKEASYKSYKSRAMGIVEERMRVINSMKEGELSIQIYDLLDTENIARGTKVWIKFPSSSLMKEPVEMT